MRKGRRSKERLFYWPSRALLGLIFAAMAMPAVWAQGPALTTISDTVYRADGTVAAGTALISWPAFQTAITAHKATITAGSGITITAAVKANYVAAANQTACTTTIPIFPCRSTMGPRGRGRSR